MAEPLDLNEPLPDRAHEAIRVGVLAAIENIAWNTASTDISFDLVDTLFQLLSTVQDAVSERPTSAQLSAVNTRAEAAQINAGTALDGVDALQARVAALESRLAAVEQALNPNPGP